MPGEHFGVGALWAAAVPLGAAGDGGLVFMAFVADPPDFFVAGWDDVLGGEAAVFLWVPLADDKRILACEVVLAGDDFLPAQTGQPLPLTRALTAARHWWPLSQTHQTLRRLPGRTSWGVSVPFFVGCHWRARSG